LFVGYSWTFRREIKRQWIVKAEKIDHISGLTQWGGWGYRYRLIGGGGGWSMNEIGYIAKNGPGIRLTYKETEEEDGKQDNNKVIVFNCEQAEKVCRMLNTPILNAVVH
jgi:hypothetical protein